MIEFTSVLFRGFLMKRRIVVGIVVVAVIALVSGATLLAFASPGTQEDPMVTLSHLTDVFKPQVMTEVRAIEQEVLREADEKIADAIAKIQDGPGSLPDPVGFQVVTLTRNQRLACSVGAEVMLRIGTAAAEGSETALVDTSAGAALSAGDSLTVNHMNLVTIEGNGLRATADTVRVLVRGEYRIT